MWQIVAAGVFIFVKKLAAQKQSEKAFPKRLGIRLDILSGQNSRVGVATAVAALPVVSHPPAEACRRSPTKFRRTIKTVWSGTFLD